MDVVDESRAADAAWDLLGKASGAIECEAYEAAARFAEEASTALDALNDALVAERIASSAE